MRLARLSIIFFSSAFFGAADCVSAGADAAGVIVTTGAVAVSLLAGALTWTSALAAAWLAAVSANDVGTVRRVVSSGAVVPAAQAVVPARDKRVQSVTAICLNTIVPPVSAALYLRAAIHRLFAAQVQVVTRQLMRALMLTM